MPGLQARDGLAAINGSNLTTAMSAVQLYDINRLTNPTLSVGLPPFLTQGAGMFSGMMLSQYTADRLIVEQRML